MTAVRVNYHVEDGTVWADSPDVDGLAVAATTLAEARDLVREGLPFYLGEGRVEVIEAVTTPRGARA